MAQLRIRVAKNEYEIIQLKNQQTVTQTKTTKITDFLTFIVVSIYLP